MRTVKEILNLLDGKFIQADEFFNRPEEEVFLDRRALEEAAQRHEKTLVCAICHQALKIRGDKTGSVSIHFAHLYDSGDCPIKTGRKYTKEEIERMKYNGVKESLIHIKLKNAIAGIIRRDERFSDIKVDETFKSQGLSKEWKRPDVSAVFSGEKVVFEVQLSTTFLSVIVQRETFYRENSTYIMWLFNEFNTDAETQKFTEKDIIYSNNNNAFVINDETITLSEDSGKFMLFCYYRKPSITESGNVSYRWEKDLISYDGIKFDAEARKVYFYDSRAEKKKLQQELSAKFNEGFESFWLSRHQLSYEDRRDKLADYADRFSRKGIKFSPYDDKLHKILDALYTLKYRRMIGYDFKNYISLANTILEYRKEYGELFLLALKHFGLEETVRSEDKKGAFQGKVEKLSTLNVQPEQSYNSFFMHLFPELPIQEELI
jgi:competence CoiA-like predicted nuclease